MTLTALSTIGFADAFTDPRGDTFLLSVSGDTGAITSTRTEMRQPEFAGTADEAAANFASWRSIADGTGLTAPEDHIPLDLYRASGADVTEHPEARWLLNALGEIPWQGRGSLLCFHRRCAAEYLIRGGVGCIPRTNDTRTPAEKEAEADLAARRHLWEVELVASDDLIAWATAGFGADAVAVAAGDFTPLLWACTAREHLADSGVAAAGPNGDMTDDLITNVLLHGVASTLQEALASVRLWQRLLSEQDPEAEPDESLYRCRTAALWLVELLCDPDLADRWLATVPEPERQREVDGVAWQLDAGARPYEFRVNRTAGADLRSSFTGEQIDGDHVVVFDRIAEEDGAVLSVADVRELVLLLLPPDDIRQLAALAEEAGI